MQAREPSFMVKAPIAEIVVTGSKNTEIGGNIDETEADYICGAAARGDLMVSSVMAEGLFGTVQSANVNTQRDAAPMLFSESSGAVCDVPIEESHISVFTYYGATAEQFTQYGVYLQEQGYQIVSGGQEGSAYTYEISNGERTYTLFYDSMSELLRETWHFDRCVSQTIATSGAHTVALRVDGTVVAVGDNNWGMCDTGSWTDIVAVAAHGILTVGLKVDGTVVAAELSEDNSQCGVSRFRAIAFKGYKTHRDVTLQ